MGERCFAPLHGRSRFVTVTLLLFGRSRSQSVTSLLFKRSGRPNRRRNSDATLLNAECPHKLCADGLKTVTVA